MLPTGFRKCTTKVIIMLMGSIMVPFLGFWYMEHWVLLLVVSLLMGLMIKVIKDRALCYFLMVDVEVPFTVAS